MPNNQVGFNDVLNTADITVNIDALESTANRKNAERDELNKQVEAFLSSGGKIDIIEPNVLADPPKKPTSNYGSQPI